MVSNALTPGESIPDDINVIIEIAAHSQPVKYEGCKDTGLLKVDRFLATSMVYPCNYGYVPNTMCDDGDPLDVLVISPFPIQPGALVRARPIGMLAMTDEAGIDHKILAVPVDKLSRHYTNINNPEDLPDDILKGIEHFFEHYKDLDSGKWVKVDGWEKSDVAKKAIIQSVEAFKDI